MLLTVSKRLEFSASRRLFVKDWSGAQNLAAFGPETSAIYGSGRNYVAYFIFSGTVDPVTGMLLNISKIKEWVGQVLRDSFDHKFLNEDNPAFTHAPPTAENVVRELFLQAAPLFHSSSAKLVACHLAESEERSATFYATGEMESNYWLEFSAARQTMSPRLTAQENKKLFGAAASPFGHGHNYRARLTFRHDHAAARPAPEETNSLGYEDIARCLAALRGELDHKNLNHEVPGLSGQAITTENLARHIHERVAGTLPILRVRLHEHENFFAEYWKEDQFFLGLRLPFSAAHRLHSDILSPEQNLALYGKCNNPRGHGHRYVTEATVGGPLEERSGALMDLAAFERAMAEGVRPWDNKHLDLETEEFRNKPSTGENIVEALWPGFDSRLKGRLVRLRLWETANNRFTLRKL
jgi:6-pyruvoyltetrahydropterin/6-carboxytetrahydropterin synthase